MIKKILKKHLADIAIIGILSLIIILIAIIFINISTLDDPVEYNLLPIKDGCYAIVTEYLATYKTTITYRIGDQIYTSTGRLVEIYNTEEQPRIVIRNSNISEENHYSLYVAIDSIQINHITGRSR